MNLIEKRDLGFLAYWGINTILRAFPPMFRLKHAMTIARPLARLWLLLSPREHNQTLHNLKLMLNERSPAKNDLSQINLSLHEGAVWVFLVTDILPRLSQAQIREISEVRGLEHLEAARAKGRGAILLNAHYGAHGYLVMAILIAHGCPATAVTGEEGMPDGLRKFGQEVPDRSWLYRKLIHPMRRSPRLSLPFLTRGSVPNRQMGAILKRNEVLWLMGDQHLTKEEAERETFALPVPFLWGIAKVRSGPLRLSKLFGAPILPTFTIRQGTRLIVEIEEPLELRTGTSQDDTIADIRAYMERVEHRVLTAPDQWVFTRHENLPNWIKSTPSEG